MNLLSIFCFKKSKIIKKLMGPEKNDLFMELSDEAKERMNRPRPKTKSIDLRTGKEVEE